MTPHERRQAWRALRAREENAWELDEAAFLIAAAEYPDLVLSVELGRLDVLAARVRESLSAPSPESLCRHLFEIEGFLGNREAYDDPRNSYLNEVLDRRLAIPITLSVLAISIGRRVGVRLHGVGMPGHFLLGSDSGALFDAFAGGVPVTPEECEARFRSLYGPAAAWSPGYLAPSPKRAIAARMLQNLKLAYLEQNDCHRARRIVEMLLALAPDSQPDLELLRQLREWQARLN